MIILGTKFFGHDSAICLIDTDKKTIFALSTERFTRVKHDQAPVAVMSEFLADKKIDVMSHSFSDFSAADFCLESSGEGAARAIEDFLKSPYSVKFGEATDLENLPQELRQQSQLARLNGVNAEIYNRQQVSSVINTLFAHCNEQDVPALEFYDHHLCHAISAYYSSAFVGMPSLVVSIDGQGDGHFGKAYMLDGNSVEEIGKSPLTGVGYLGGYSVGSLGSIYSNFTRAGGFRPNSDEGKIEALAAFGKPIEDTLNDLTSACIIANNSIYLDADKIAKYYDDEYLKSLISVHGRENYCSTIQTFLENIVVEYLNAIEVPEGTENLCLCGGVAANILMNLAIYERTRFKKIHIAPFMGDEGTAYGAAVIAAKAVGEDVSWLLDYQMPYFGPSYTEDQVEAVLQAHEDSISFKKLGDDWPLVAAAEIADGKVIAAFHGRAEFGPRALGNRSILANPADPNIREKLNISIKQRPPWQPFCPSIIDTERERLFTDSFPHKHMATAFRLKDEWRKALPAASHIDGTARPQFVSETDNPAYYRLIEAVKQRTGFGVVLNTSFNLHGRAMVMSPEHAIQDMLDCNLDVLFLEGYRVWKKTGEDHFLPSAKLGEAS